MYRPILFIFLTGCAAVPFKDIKQGDVSNLAYSVAQLIEYRKQPQWLDAETVIDRGWGDCKGKATVACYVINQWPDWSCWYDYPSEYHVRAMFYDFKTQSKGYIDGRVVYVK